eukprot:1523264-Rhodomonas_salina.3
MTMLRMGGRDLGRDDDDDRVGKTSEGELLAGTLSVRVGETILAMRNKGDLVGERSFMHTGNGGASAKMVLPNPPDFPSPCSCISDTNLTRPQLDHGGHVSVMGPSSTRVGG